MASAAAAQDAAAKVVKRDPEVAPERLPKRVRFEVRSTADQTMQPVYLTIPESVLPKSEKNSQIGTLVPVVVSLHSWSADLEQRQPAVEVEVAARKWFLLQPNFRGINDHPQALGSELAQQDILDAVDWLLQTYPVDPQRVYLTGISGGGHMTLMMAGRYPNRWRAASAWVGIHDLALWYSVHQHDRYGEMMRQSCQGGPADSPEMDNEYLRRSPKRHMAGAQGVALDIAAGIHDGHDGSVPIRHSLDAFNVLARANGDKAISEQEIQQVSVRNGRLAQPQAGDLGYDPTFHCDHYLRRTSGRARVTIFDGGHEGIASAVLAWFDAH